MRWTRRRRETSDADARRSHLAETGGPRTAKSCGPDAPTLASTRATTLARCTGDGGKKARLTREITKETVKTIAQGVPDRSGGPVVTYSCAFFSAHEAAGAPTHRHSLRPLYSGATCLCITRAQLAPRECGLMSHAV